MPYKSEREHAEHEKLMELVISLIMLGVTGFAILWGLVFLFSILILAGLVI